MTQTERDAQRIENNQILECPNRGTATRSVREISWEGVITTVVKEVAFDYCGPWKRLNPGQERCSYCGKTFTY